MTEETILFNGDPFDNFDPTLNGIGETKPIPFIDAPSPEIVDGGEIPSTTFETPEPIPSEHEPITGTIGSNNSDWPCACTGLYI